MAKIEKARAVLLSDRYDDAGRNLEALLHLPSGYRTTGMVELTLDDGTTGLGEGYLAVFAPRVFEEIVRLLEPHLIGAEVEEHDELMRKLATVTGYWSLQGAAQHALSAVDIALWDCLAKLKGEPVYKLLGGESRSMKLYASGGDSLGPKEMEGELERVEELGIDLFKIRARNHQVDKAVWCVIKGGQRGIRIGVDMTQNLAIPSQSAQEAIAFAHEVERLSGNSPVFLEEAVGPEAIEEFVTLQQALAGKVKVTGGEIVTTEREMRERIDRGCYDIAQPDATVIGGISPVARLFRHCQQRTTDLWVHCWGGPVGMMANYHAALGCGGSVVEWPMPDYGLRQAMVVEPWSIEGGELKLSEAPGLGVQLTEEIESKYAFRGDAVYACVVDASKAPQNVDWGL